MTDPNAAMGGQEPTEAELRAYLEQLRGADPAEFLVQAFNMLGTGAQAKLGLPDARVLIDAMDAMVTAVGDRLPGELAEPLGQAVVQLKAAQAQTERELAAREAPGAEQAEPPEGQSAGEPGAPPAGQPQTSEPEQRMTDRLWVPGRGPQPPGV